VPSGSTEACTGLNPSGSWQVVHRPASGPATGGRDPTKQPTDRVPAEWFREWADGAMSTGRLRTQSVKHPGRARTKAGRDGKGSRKGENKKSGDHANGKPGKGNGK
jgi:hypothetical protein